MNEYGLTKGRKTVAGKNEEEIYKILGFNWMYLSRTLSANRRVGIYPPRNIKRLVSLSILIAFLTITFVAFFLVFGHY